MKTRPARLGITVNAPRDLSAKMILAPRMNAGQLYLSPWRPGWLAGNSCGSPDKIWFRGLHQQCISMPSAYSATTAFVQPDSNAKTNSSKRTSSKSVNQALAVFPANERSVPDPPGSRGCHGII